MKSEIQLAFEKCKNQGRPALISYTVASDPNKKKSLKILESISSHVDIAEVGFPFSTPSCPARLALYFSAVSTRVFFKRRFRCFLLSSRIIG